jgi:ketosteroid isomerase-like protein
MTPNHTRRDETLIRDLIEAWAAAVRRKDVAGILRNRSANVLMFDVPPPLKLQGIDAYCHSWDMFFSWSREPVTFDVTEMHVTVGSDVAFAAALMRCAGVEPGGDTIEMDFRLTVGLQKIDEKWVVTHEHHSIPAEK